MFIETEKIPGNNETNKIHSLTQALAHLESLISIKLITKNSTKTAIAMFGNIKDTDKAKKLILHNNSTIQMKESQLYNVVETKHKTIRVYIYPL